MRTDRRNAHGAGSAVWDDDHHVGDGNVEERMSVGFACMSADHSGLLSRSFPGLSAEGSMMDGHGRIDGRNAAKSSRDVGRLTHALFHPAWMNRQTKCIRMSLSLILCPKQGNERRQLGVSKHCFEKGGGRS